MTSPSIKVLNTVVGQFLLYRGPQEVVRLFLRVDGAHIYDGGETLVLPLCKANVMALEILGQMEEPDEHYRARVRELLWPSRKALDLHPLTVPGAPEPKWHQRATFGACLDTLISGGSGFGVFNCLGSGKTRIAIDLMRHLSSTMPWHLVIGVKVTLEQWVEELARAWPEAEAHVLHRVGKGSIPERAGHLYQLRLTIPKAPQVILINWEALASLEKDLKKLPKFDCIIADESAKLLGRTTAMARAAKRLAWKHAWYAIPMTGTPIRRSVEDLLALYQFADSRVFGSRIADFREQYCEETFNGMGGVAYVPKQDKVVDLVQKIYSAGFRVSRAAVDLPEPERRVVRLKPSKEQEEQLALIKSGPSSDAANVLARIVRSQQITAGFTGVSDEVRAVFDGGLFKPFFAPRYLNDPKADWIEEYLRDLMATEDAKVVVWTKFIPEIEELHARLGGTFPGAVARIDGSVPDSERQIIRRHFNDRSSELRVLVMNLQTGSLGLDLPVADVLVYHSSSYNFVDRVQSEGRGTRLGRTQPCILIDLVLAGTIDEDIQQNLARKQSVSDLLVGAGFIRKQSEQ